MSLNENSSRDQILEYVKKYPIIFFHYYSDKPWAQPYLYKALNIAVKKRPFDFLHDFFDKPWAQPYPDEAAKGVAKENPEYFLEHLSNRFPQGINTALFAFGSENVTK